MNSSVIARPSPRVTPVIKTIFPFAGINDYAPKQNHESRMNTFGNNLFTHHLLMQ
jgi:hypothetical protein